MNKINVLTLLLSFLLWSCTEKEEIVTINDSTGPGSLAFLAESSSGFETEASISFKNQSANYVQYQWDFGDGVLSNDENAQHSYTAPGKYVVTLSGTTSTGNVSSFSRELFVREKGAQLDILFISYQDSTLNFMGLSEKRLQTLYKVPYNPAGVLALNEAAGRVYYFDYTNNAIIENGLTLNDPVVLFEDMPGVSDMEFDQSTSRLFISLSYSDQILTYNTQNGWLIDSYRTVNSGRFGKVRDMDLKAGNIYTITPTQSYESIFKLDVSQGNVEQLIDYELGGYGYGVAFDDLNNKIYFNNVEEAALMRADSDGSNVEKVIDLDRYGTVPFTGLCLVGLKVVETRNQVMWSAWDDGFFHTIDLDTNEESILEINGLYGKFVPFENNGILSF